MSDVLVVGGGAAGMLAAARASQQGARVTLLEKMPRLGTKILISGGGKCNLTHAGPMEEVRAAFRPNEARFLKPAFYKFTNTHFLDILHARGMETYTRPDGRVFPTPPADAKDVVALLTQFVRDAGVQVRTNCAVSQLLVENGTVCGVRVGDETVTADRVVVSTGGSSYPATGTTGDGWRWLREGGHSVETLRAALAPLYLDAPNPDWSGVALRGATLKARLPHKQVVKWTGDLLFTHKGVSGPSALGVSRDIAEATSRCIGLPQGGERGSLIPPNLEAGGATIEADLAPDTAFEDVQAQLKAGARDNTRRTAASLVAPFVPARLVEPLLLSAGIGTETRAAQLSVKDLNKLTATIKGWPLGTVRHVPLERGEVVAGGVVLDEVDAQTMQSKLVRGLYLCGEVLDIAGPVGGYNFAGGMEHGLGGGTECGRLALRSLTPRPPLLTREGE